ncbi:DUF2510 domain-containing protein [Gordonia sp. DT30]|uniref:DUF2510 domain-containing protein n=1 Tax=Gordonia sp. DT30 TaxID=3416546 RepID=UPI003CEC5E6C
MPVITYEGNGCTAVLDTETQTVTLNHSGLMSPGHKKKASPWTIPLGDIVDVDLVEKSLMERGWVRFITRDRRAYHKVQREDTNAFFAGKAKLGPFVDAVMAARPQRPSAAAPESEGRGIEFHGIRLTGDTIFYDGRDYPIAGARAVVETGAERKRITATRIVVVGILAAAAKKDETRLYLTITLGDGQVLVAELPRKDEAAARQFAATLTSAGATAGPTDAATPPPPPPTVPAGWYADPNNAALQRYWDGAQWTEHTAPAP